MARVLYFIWGLTVLGAPALTFAALLVHLWNRESARRLELIAFGFAVSATFFPVGLLACILAFDLQQAHANFFGMARVAWAISVPSGLIAALVRTLSIRRDRPAGD